MLPTAEIIRTKRREKNITQEELAQFLGVSFQAVSRWENGQAYPDIELLPKIAVFFNISTDQLLGNDRETREAEIENLYYTCCDAARQENDPLKRYKLRMETYKKLPDHHKWTYHLAADLCSDLIYSDILPREEALPVVRELCRIMLNQSEDSFVRNWALRDIYLYEDESRLPDWSRYVSAFVTESDLMAFRYSSRGEYDRYNAQLQENLFQTLWNIFPLHAHKCYADEVETAHAIVSASETTLKLYDLFRNPSCDMDLFLEQRGWTYLYLSKAEFRLGNKENGYASLEKAVELCEKLFTLPDGEELKCTHPSFDLLVISNSTYIPSGKGYSLRSQYSNFYNALTVSEEQWEWFRPYMNEDRFQALTNRVKAAAPHR